MMTLRQLRGIDSGSSQSMTRHQFSPMGTKYTPLLCGSAYNSPSLLLEVTGLPHGIRSRTLKFEAAELAGLAGTIISLPDVPGAQSLDLGDPLRELLEVECPNTSQRVFVPGGCTVHQVYCTNRG
jgi:hypothetical protein